VESSILEVAAVSREMFIDHSWQQTWLGSTRTIQIQGVFTAKAGSDLREPFRIDIVRRPLHAVARVPPPKILSIDMKEYKILKDENGWWNSVTPRDREEAVRQIRAEAIDKATHSGLLEESRASVEARVREIVERNGSTVVFRNEPADRRPKWREPSGILAPPEGSVSSECARYLTVARAVLAPSRSGLASTACASSALALDVSPRPRYPRPMV
jgi:hypothetical protein